jgi:small subunit ribosomal protein S4e
MEAQLGEVPYITTHDGRTVRFPDPEIKVGDSIECNLKTGNNEEFYKMRLLS